MHQIRSALSLDSAYLKHNDRWCQENQQLHKGFKDLIYTTGCIVRRSGGGITEKLTISGPISSFSIVVMSIDKMKWSQFQTVISLRDSKGDLENT